MIPFVEIVSNGLDDVAFLADHLLMTGGYSKYIFQYLMNDDI